MSDDETLSVYAQKARDYAQLTDDQNAHDPLLTDFINAMPTGGSILDLGCGPGTSAAVMARAGLKVTAFDPVPQMVRLARQHEGVEAREAGFDDLSGFDLYDGIWANFSLLHAPRADMPRHLKAIADALKPQGRFHIALKTGEGSKRDRLGRFYTYYNKDELTQLVEAAGMRVFDSAEGTGTGLDGSEAAWVSLAAHG